MKIVFDIEANSKYHYKVDKVHCICTADISSDIPRAYAPSNLQNGVKYLSTADLLIGHNITSYDLPVLERLYPDIELTSNIFDTFIASHLMFPDLYILDVKRKLGSIPKELYGKHSLKAWGYRLGILKGTFCEETDWQNYSKEMLEYCSQDVRVNVALYNFLQENIKLLSPKAFQIEQQFAYIMSKQIAHGVLVDRDKILEIVDKLEPRRVELLDELQKVFPPRYVNKGEFTPKVNNIKTGYKVGCTLTKIELQKFNPHSSNQVITRLKELGWEPVDFTDTGNPSTKEEHLSKFDNPSVKVLVEYKKVCNVIGKLYSGDESWWKYTDENSRIHGEVFAFGTNTRRCSHSHPNVTQNPKNDYFKGYKLDGLIKCREVAIAPDGYVIVGGDASGLELRCLANAMNDMDYVNEILSGDIHTKNQIAAGLPTRDDAKTFIYGFTYGAGNAKIGSIIKKDAKAGEEIKKKFLDSLPSLGRLMDDVKNQVHQYGYILSIDNVKVPIPKDKEYIGLNYYLQGMGAIVMKLAYINFYVGCLEQGWKVYGKDYDVATIMYNHDELQVECKPEIADEVGKTIVKAIKQAGVDLGFVCPLDGAFKVGRNWSETH